MSNVVLARFNTTQNLDPDLMLESMKGCFDTVIYAGRDKDGVFRAGSSIGDVGEMLVFLELFKAELMRGVE
jgi:hypothetical protein